MTFLFGVLEKLIPSFAIPFTPVRVRSILVVDLNFLGDMLLSSPVYRALKKHFPDARIESLILPLAKPALSVNPFVDAIHLMPSTVFTRQLQTAAALRKCSFDLVLQLNTSLKTNILLWIIGRRYRVGYNYAHRGCLLNVRVPILTRTAKVGRRIDECIGLLEQAFGWIIHEREMVFPVDQQHTKRIRSLLQSNGIRHGDLLVGMHTNCRQDWKKRRWDMRNFTLLGNELLKNNSAKLVLTGSPDDVPYVAELVRTLQPPDRVINLAGTVTLYELAALFTQLTILITLNTGPMHIAIALRCPTLAIIGGTPAPVVFPSNDPEFDFVMDPALEQWDPTVLTHSYEPLINSIGVDVVLKKAIQLLQRQAGIRMFRETDSLPEVTAR
jgi:ADP-heptose:LPS heptosyltransferase